MLVWHSAIIIIFAFSIFFDINHQAISCRNNVVDNIDDTKLSTCYQNK